MIKRKLEDEILQFFEFLNLEINVHLGKGSISLMEYVYSDFVFVKTLKTGLIELSID